MKEKELEQKEKEWKLERQMNAIEKCKREYWHSDCLNYVVWYNGENKEISTIHYTKDEGVTMIVCMDGTTISSNFVLRAYLGEAPDETSVYSGDLVWVNGIGGERALSVFRHRGYGSSTCDGWGLQSSLHDIIEVIGFIGEHEEFFLDYLIERIKRSLDNYHLGERSYKSLCDELGFLHEAKRLRDFDVIYGWGAYGYLSMDDRALLRAAISNVNTLYEIKEEREQWREKERSMQRKASDALKTKSRDYNVKVRKHILSSGKVVYRALAHYDSVDRPIYGEAANPFDAIKCLAEKMKGSNYGASFINCPW